MAGVVGVGPHATFPRYEGAAPLRSRAHGSGRIAVGEVFSAGQASSVEAARRTSRFSLMVTRLGRLFAPGQPRLQVEEFPKKMELFGLGHLGQAISVAHGYLAVRRRAALLPYLCDDDAVELPETWKRALLRPHDLPGT
jgi:hypothetical protein